MYLKISFGRGHAGAGFRTTVAPASWAILAALRTEGMGVSSWRSRMPHSLSSFSQESMSASVRSPLAPEATTMQFSACWSTEMRATPEGWSERSIPLTSRPSFSYCAIELSPKISLPTLQMNLTFPPRRCAATAWFAPLPPAPIVNTPPSTVSPGRGSSLVFTVMSVLLLPMTRIPFLLI